MHAVYKHIYILWVMVVLMLVTPIIKTIMRLRLTYIVIILLVLIGVGRGIYMLNIQNANVIFSKFYELLIYLPNFVLGMLFAKYKSPILNVLCGFNKKIIYMCYITIILMVILVNLAVEHISILYMDYIVVPLFVLIIIIIYNNTNKNTMIWKVFKTVGIYSTELWLIHSILINYCESIVYYPRISLLILCWCMILQIPIVAVVKYLYNKIVKLVA